MSPESRALAARLYLELEKEAQAGPLDYRAVLLKPDLLRFAGAELVEEYRKAKVPAQGEASTESVLGLVREERCRQDRKWGVQNHDPLTWLGILMEEVGEAAEATLKHLPDEYVTEMTQVAAVAIAAIENYRDKGRPEYDWLD